MRTGRVIAVFGPSHDPSRSVLDCAEALGRAVAAAGDILLTGGTGPAGEKVKNRAILGAGDRRWIGVDPRGSVSADQSPGSFVIRTGLGDKRNYVEACICDAAVALPGGDGTVSEVACSLALKRPVAFVGSEWRRICDLDQDLLSVLTPIVERTTVLLGDAGEREVRSLLAGRRDLLPAYRYFDVCDARAVVDWVESVVPETQLDRRQLPSFGGLDALSGAYASWLREE